MENFYIHTILFLLIGITLTSFWKILLYRVYSKSEFIIDIVLLVLLLGAYYGIFTIFWLIIGNSILNEVILLIFLLLWTLLPIGIIYIKKFFYQKAKLWINPNFISVNLIYVYIFPVIIQGVIGILNKIFKFL